MQTTQNNTNTTENNSGATRDILLFIFMHQIGKEKSGSLPLVQRYPELKEKNKK